MPPTNSKNIKLNRIIQQTAALTAKSDAEASTRMAIQSIQSTIASIQAAVTTLINANNSAGGDNGYSTINTTTTTLTNKSGVARNSGDVVIQSTGFDNAFSTTTTPNSPLVIGCVASDSLDGTTDAIAINADGIICTSGVSAVKVDADVDAISPGDYLVSHSTAGVAVKAANAFAQGVFAIALEALASGTDTIDALIIPVSNRDLIKYELLTASDASNVTLSETPYDSSEGLTYPAVIIVDMTLPGGTASFPNSLSTALPAGARCSLTNTGAVITNSLADWGTGAGNIFAIYLPATRVTDENQFKFLTLIMAYVSQYELARSATAWTHSGLHTTAKTMQGAVNEVVDEIHNARINTSQYLKFTIDTTGSATGVSGALLSFSRWIDSAMASRPINDGTFTYSTDANSELIMLSALVQYYGFSTVTPQNTVNMAFGYLNGYLNTVIKDLS
jgi:hypothetical protein